MLVAGGFLFPAYLRFSPDDQRLVASVGDDLIVIEAATGSTSVLLHTDNGVLYPEWSPNGDQILYSRLLRLPEEPPDSAGLHRYDLATGRDTPFVVDGSVIAGAHARWSSDGSSIVMVSSYPPKNPTVGGIFLVRPDGGDFHLLASPPTGFYYDSPQWREHLAVGSREIFFRARGGAQSSTFRIRPDGMGLVQWPLGLSQYDEISPDGQNVVMLGSDPGDSEAVLFLSRINDFLGTSRRRLTSWHPPIR